LPPSTVACSHVHLLTHCNHHHRHHHPCRPFAEKYAVDQDAFFADYVAAHLKLSELG